MHNNYLTITLASPFFEDSITLLGRVIVGVIVALLKEKRFFLFKVQQLPEQLPGPEV